MYRQNIIVPYVLFSSVRAFPFMTLLTLALATFSELSMFFNRRQIQVQITETGVKSARIWQLNH